MPLASIVSSQESLPGVTRHMGIIGVAIA